MVDITPAFLDQAEREFNGKSFNAPPFLATLSSLAAGEAASTATYEGYSAWAVAAHVLRYKHFVLGKILRDGSVLSGDDFPKPVPGSGEAEWKALLAELESTHESVMAAIRGLGPERLGEKVEEWGIELGTAVAWLLGHDAYHNAQVRNMGLPSLRG